MKESMISLIQTAQKCFPDQHLRLWYVKMAPNSWKTIIFNPLTKQVLAQSEIRNTPVTSIIALQGYLDTQYREGAK